MYFTRSERAAIMRLCIQLAGVDGEFSRRENRFLDAISEDIEFGGFDYDELDYMDLPEALSIISDLSEREKSYVRSAIMGLTEADGYVSNSEIDLANLARILGDL